MTTIVEYICDKLNITYSDLSNILSGEIKNYTPHTVKTKRKTRIVYQPSEFLRKLQKMVVDKVFSQYPVSSYSTAYEPGCSVLINAKKHQKSKFLAKYDVKDFFGSIKFWHFGLLLGDKYSNHEITLLWKICSLNDSLPIGAYSSSFIVNRIMYGFDNEIGKRFKGVRYSRYADDMVFSSDSELPADLPAELKLELRQIRFELNDKKTRHYSDKTPKRITGVTVTPDNKLTVGKKYKLAIKKQLYDYITKRKGNKRKIMGRLRYIKFIEPAYYEMLVDKYRLNNNLITGTGKPFGNKAREEYKPKFVRNNNLDLSQNPGQKQNKRQSKLIVFLAVFFAIILTGFLILYVVNFINKEGNNQLNIREDELTTLNYSKYITLSRDYATGYDYTEFRINIINKSEFLIKDIVIDLFIINGNSIVFMDTIYFDIFGAVPKKSDTFRLDSAHPNFSEYEFQYASVKGTITTLSK